MLVVLNFSDKEAAIDLAEVGTLGKTLINNYDQMDNQEGKMTLQPYQAVILSVEN